MQQALLLPKINSPDDIKKLKTHELKQLALEIREEIVRTVSNNGGHLASNLGVVELSIALHKVFNSPEDKIVWDVGHQCYAHKILTGRFNNFSTLRKKDGIAGFPKTSESHHDAFNTGHASTSISAALGLLAADKLLGGKRCAIAVIGDGALTGGLAYEALSHAGHLELPLIVILNDNKMSISENVGGLSKYLSRLSLKAKYQTFRRHFDTLAKKIPLIGSAFFNLVLRLKRAVKAVFYTDNFFVDLGFEYVGPISGHNINALISIFQDARQLNRPVVIHVITQKGKGYGFAEDEPDSYHGVSSFSVDGGLDSGNIDASRRNISFTECFSRAILKAGKSDEKIVALTAAMQTGTGLSLFKNAFPSRFFDVGIAEEHMLTFAAGLAARGLKPVVAVYSTFIQRAVDQVIHDIALQKLPVILALDRAGLVCDDGETHQGLYDIALFRSAPNMTILCPASETELELMLEWAVSSEQRAVSSEQRAVSSEQRAVSSEQLAMSSEQRAVSSEQLAGSGEQRGAVIIRYPKAFCPDEVGAFSLPVERGRGVWVSKRDRKEVCIVFTGSLYMEAAKAASVMKEQGVEADLYNLRFVKPLDEDAFTDILNEYKLVAFVEEGIREGGFGEYAVSLARNRNCSAFTVVLAVESRFLEEDLALGTREQLLKENGLDGNSIAQKLTKTLKMVYDKS
jgi:1-deoxy-D-xylulose-5-phosphate synthase